MEKLLKFFGYDKLAIDDYTTKGFYNKYITIDYADSKSNEGSTKTYDISFKLLPSININIEHNFNSHFSEKFTNYKCITIWFSWLIFNKRLFYKHTQTFK